MRDRKDAGLEQGSDGPEAPGADVDRDAELLESAAAELARNPRATMADLARACGAGRATLHRRYGERSALLRSIALHAIAGADAAAARAEEAAPSDAAAFLQLLIQGIMPLGDRFRVMDQDPDLRDDPEIRAALERQNRQLRELAGELKAAGLIDPSTPDAWFASAFDGLLFSAWLAVGAGDVAPKDAPQLFYRTLLEGLGPRPVEGGKRRSSGVKQTVKKPTRGK